MNKLTLIATCALETKAVLTLEDAFSKILSIFKSEFPNENFNSWNTELNDSFVEKQIQEKKNVSDIYIKNFIQFLWDK